MSCQVKRLVKGHNPEFPTGVGEGEAGILRTSVKNNHIVHILYIQAHGIRQPQGQI